MAQLDWYIRAHLKPRHLQLLAALDTYRHIGRAAASLNLSQPAVSLSLGELEKGLGLVLFERHARGVTPNAYGECLVRHARQLLAGLEQAREELQALQTGAAGKLQVGVLPAVASALMPQALAAYKRAYPTSQVAVTEGSLDNLLPLLRSGQLELLVGRLMTRAADDVSEQALYDGLNVVVVRRDHPLAKRRKLRWPDLQDYPWVLPPSGSLAREPLEVALRQHGMALPRDAIETLSNHVIAGYLQHTQAVALLSRLATQPLVREGKLAILPLDLPDPRRPIGVMWLKQRPQPPAALRLVSFLQQEIQRLS